MAHLCSGVAAIVDAAVQGAHGFIRGKFEGHVGDVLQQRGQVPSEQSAHARRIHNCARRGKHIGVYAGLCSGQHSRPTDLVCHAAETISS